MTSCNGPCSRGLNLCCCRFPRDWQNIWNFRFPIPLCSCVCPYSPSEFHLFHCPKNSSFHWEGSSRKCLSTPCFSNTQSERSTTSYTDVISEDNTAVSVVHWIIKGKSLVNNFTYHSVTECKSVFKKGNKNKSLSGLTLFYYWEERLSRKAPWSLMFDKIRLI